MGANRLMKSDQLIDAFKSYYGLAKPPGFGLLPMLLGDGEDFLNSLLWLGMSLKKDTVADELKAMEVLQQTQPKMIEGREGFVKQLFLEIKEFLKQREYDEETW